MPQISLIDQSTNQEKEKKTIYRSANLPIKKKKRKQFEFNLLINVQDVNLEKLYCKEFGMSNISNSIDQSSYLPINQSRLKTKSKKQSKTIDCLITVCYSVTNI